MSVISRSGCSSAAKWPPRGISVRRTRLKRAATHSRGRHDDLLREDCVRGRDGHAAGMWRRNPVFVVDARRRSRRLATRYSVMLVSDPEADSQPMRRRRRT